MIAATPNGIYAIVLAYLVSPYGIPMFAAWLIGTIQAANERLKSI
ncbi:MAG: CD1845 family protein [Clostridia bacterium]|nr:CD1845 family protein [Clostridia bacterium]